MANLNPNIIQPKKSLKQIVAEEYVKCSQDPVHFMKKYCMIQHPVRGKIQFQLYPFQEKTLMEFATNRYNIVLKSRQTGISTLSAGYALWKMLFNSDFNVLVIATKQDVAKNLVTKVRVMHDLLPTWLKGGAMEDNKLSLKLSNGSQIKAIASSPDAGRSEALSLLVIDECQNFETEISIRNKETGEVRVVKLGELYESTDYL
jgi:phage terminase large subunit-like protein